VFSMLCVLISLFSGPSYAGNYTTTINLIQWYHGRDCVFFTLEGVAEADSINPSSSWFAIPGTQTDYAQIYALLLSAKMAGSSVNVITTGSAAGGACSPYAGVSVVTLQ
jgi:hypothetical protein